MLTLRSSEFDASQRPLSVRAFAPFVAPVDGDVSLRAVAQRITAVRSAALTYTCQNLALIAPPAPYKGATSREEAAAAFLRVVTTDRPDVVGVCEAWGGERSVIASVLSGAYPHVSDGPDESDAKFDGGLLLLSRHPIIRRAQLIYRHHQGEDGLVNKGALYALVQLPDGTRRNVVLSHTQNPDPFFSGDATAVVRKQMSDLERFVRASRDGRWPTIVMGDLNTNASVPAVYRQFMRQWPGALDLWATLRPGENGITSDDARAFEDDDPRMPPDDTRRDRRGKRIDYILLVSDDASHRLAFDTVAVEVHQIRPGFDLSDHYAITATERVLFDAPAPSRPLPLRAAITSFACLHETSGATSTGLGSDEIEVAVTITTSTGRRVSLGPTARVGNVDPGTRHRFSSPPTVELGDPGRFLDVTATAFEIDTVLGNVVDRARMGPTTTRIERPQLHARDELEVAVLVAGAGGLYSVYTTLTVNR